MNNCKNQTDLFIANSPAIAKELCSKNLKDAGKQLGIDLDTLPSGAGHDAAVFANAGVPSAMIFIRNEHGSHNPHEAMDMEDFMLGTRLLMKAVL